MNNQEALSWLATEPPEQEIAPNDDGSQYIPIGIVEDLMTFYDPLWASENFKFGFIPIGDKMYASGSIELVMRGVRRVGAATAEVIGDFQSAEAIMLSEATKNGAKKWGPRFGKNLNARNEIIRPATVGPGKPKRASILMPPDSYTRQRYLQALADNNAEVVNSLESIYNFKIG